MTIDELERVRRFRAGEAAPSQAARREAAAALAEAMGRAGGAVAPGRPARRSRGQGSRRWLPRAAVIASVVGAAVVAVALAGPGSGAGPTSALAAAFARLAGIAAGGPSLIPHRGQYLYVDSTNNYASDAYSSGKTCVYSAPDHRQVWIGANGSGLLLERTEAPRFTSARDRATCVAMRAVGSPTAATSKLWFAAGCFELGPGNDLQALSRNPRTLLRQMRRIDGGPRSAGEDFVHVGDFLRETDASPALRAALYRAAALIPGVHLLGTVRDHLGRRGLGVAYESHGDRQELIFNPRTAALMGEADIGPRGQVYDWAAYLASRVVDHLPGKPPLPLTPPCVGGGGIVDHTRDGDVQTGAMAGPLAPAGRLPARPGPAPAPAPVRGKPTS